MKESERRPGPSLTGDSIIHFDIHFDIYFDIHCDIHCDIHFDIYFDTQGFIRLFPALSIGT